MHWQAQTEVRGPKSRISARFETQAHKQNTLFPFSSGSANFSKPFLSRDSTGIPGAKPTFCLEASKSLDSHVSI